MAKKQEDPRTWTVVRQYDREGGIVAEVYALDADVAWTFVASMTGHGPVRIEGPRDNAKLFGYFSWRCPTGKRERKFGLRATVSVAVITNGGPGLEQTPR